MELQNDTFKSRKGTMMAQKLQIYKCMACGNIVEVLHAGDGELVCCGQPMKNLVAKGADEGKEKRQDFPLQDKGY